MELKYHIRKSWDDPDSQIGIDYNFLINAKKACDKLEGYFVFDSNGIQVYPEVLKVGDLIQLTDGAEYISGNHVSEQFINICLEIKEIDGSNYKIGYPDQIDIIGTVKGKYVEPYLQVNVAHIDPYYLSVNVDKANIHVHPTADSRILDTASKFAFYKIVNEKDGWGKLEKGAGWISLNNGLVIRHEK